MPQLAASDSGSLRPPQDLSHHLNPTTRRWPVSQIKDLYKYFSIPGIGQLAGGLPNPNYFPFDTLEGQVASPNRYDPSSTAPVESQPSSITSALPQSSRVIVNKFSDKEDLTQKIDLASALQYGTAQGYPPLFDFVKKFTREHMHPRVPYIGGPDITLTVGNTDGFSKCVLALVEPWTEGVDPIEKKQGLLAEEYAFNGTLACAVPRGINIEGVKMDAQGMLAKGPGGLQDVLENWDFRRGARPHLLYTVTIGQNPTGGVLSVDRRKELYALCQKYDIIIIEDDPYWILQYESAVKANIASGKATASPLDHGAMHERSSSGFPFLDSLVPSYLSIDEDGRVVRLDTFSKLIAPGCRLGWITAQPALIERFLRLTESGTQQPSGFVQALVAQLLIGSTQPKGSSTHPMSKGWGAAGWVRWLEGLRANYERRMQDMCRVLDEGKSMLKTGSMPGVDALLESEDDETWAVVQTTEVLDFVWPAGGMFVWLEVLYDNHPLIKLVDGPRLAQALFVWLTKKDYLVLASPGAIFGANDSIKKDRAWRFHRLCFAGVEEADVTPISQRYINGVHAFFRIKDSRTIDKLLDDSQRTTIQSEDLSLLTGPC